MSNWTKVYVKGGQGVPGEASVNLGDIIHSSAGKTTPVAADEFAISDSQNSWSLRKLTLGSIVTFLQNTFATVASLSGYVPTTRTVNSKALSTNITITKADVSLGNADNTSDLNKPISTLTQTALNLKANQSELADFPRFSASGNSWSNATSWTSTATFSIHPTAAVSFRHQLGLDQVQNTSDLAKPISTATQAALDAKPSLTGSPNTFTNNNTFNGSATFAATIFANNGISATGSSDFQGNITYEGQQFYSDGTTFVYGATSVKNAQRTALDINNVSNTADIDKPISTATQTALNAKANRTGGGSFTLGAYTFTGSSNVTSQGIFRFENFVEFFECNFTYNDEASLNNHRAALGIASNETRLIATTATNVPTGLSTNGSTEVSGNQIPLSNNQAMTVAGIAIARSTTGEVKSWDVAGTVIRGANAAATTVNFMEVNSNFESPTASSWDLELQANTTLGTLRVLATGETGKTISWNCFLYIAKI